MTAKEKEVIDEMLKLINKINDRTDRLGSKERIPQLELEAIVSKIKTLYETAVVLKYLHSNADDLVLKEVEDKVKAIDSKHKEMDATIKEGEVNENEEKQKKVETPEVDLQQLKQEMDALGADKEAGVTSESTATGQATVEEKIKGQGLDDLKKAIGVNEKFLFINELFDGNKEAFENALNGLNQLDSFDEARDYLQEAKQVYSWDNESNAVNSFYELLERRYK